MAFCFPEGMRAAEEYNRKKVYLPDYYDSHARIAAKRGDLKTLKMYVDDGLKHYPSVSALNELAGLYYLKTKDYDTARFYLYKALQDNDDNVQAKQLMLDVEEITNNYSSAICYVNELLEVTPYNRDLWYRKIRLYRKQGNTEEADRLLKRLIRIYPNDKSLAREYSGQMMARYERSRADGNLVEMIDNLSELAHAGYADEEQYLILANLYQRQGDREGAMHSLSHGLQRFPGSSQLIRKKAGILATEERYAEALSFLDDMIETNPSDASLRSLKTGIVEERARQEVLNDPYSLYTKIYAEQHTQEALDYLLRVSFTRGYDVDALFYLDEAMKRRGRQPNLLYRKYQVHKRLGNFAEARPIIEEIYAMQPGNEEVATELTRIVLEDANKAMDRNDFDTAIEVLNSINPADISPELGASIYNKLYQCYVKMNRFDEAIAIADKANAAKPDLALYVGRKTGALNAAGRLREASDFALSTIRALPAETDTIGRAPLVASYEEAATPFIKELIENGSYREAYRRNNELLGVNPASETGLRNAITLADLTGRRDEHDRHVEQAVRIYPDNLDFRLKRLAIMTRDKNYGPPQIALRQELDSMPGNRDIIRAFSVNSEMLALDRIKHHNPDSAIAVIDTALIFDARNPQLLYTKGLAFEAKHQYDSAYYYQKNYVPGLLEVDDFKYHLRRLQSRQYANMAGIEYLRGRYGNIDAITSVATAFYTHTAGANTWGGRINYAGREGSESEIDPDIQTTGGVGLQFQAEYARQFSRGWSGRAALAYATRYFPRYYATIGASKELRHAWTLDASLSYRRIESVTKEFIWRPNPEEPPGAWGFNRWVRNYMDLFSLGLGATKSIGNFAVEGHVDMFYMNRSFYLNGTARARFFPTEDPRTNIYCFASAGSAPEASLIDDAMPATFQRVNSAVGLGFNYLLHRQIVVGLMGSWNTFYTQNNTRIGTETDYYETSYFNYRNLYNIAILLNVLF